MAVVAPPWAWPWPLCRVTLTLALGFRSSEITTVSTMARPRRKEWNLAGKSDWEIAKRPLVQVVADSDGGGACQALDRSCHGT